MCCRKYRYTKQINERQFLSYDFFFIKKRENKFSLFLIKPVSHKPDFVILQCRTAIIYLADALLHQSFCLPFPTSINATPPGQRKFGVYLAFHYTRFTRKMCYQKLLWAFTPHFHLFQPIKGGSYFLWHYLFP